MNNKFYNECCICYPRDSEHKSCKEIVELANDTYNLQMDWTRCAVYYYNSLRGLQDLMAIHKILIIL